MDPFLKKALGIALSFFVIGLATSMSFMEIGSGLVLALILLGILTKQIVPPRFKTIPALFPISLFAAIAILGICLSDTTLKDKIYDLGRMRFFVLYVALYIALTWEKVSLSWLKPLFWTTLIISVYGFVQHFVAIDLIRPAGKKVLLYALQNEKIGPVVVGTFNHHLTFANIYFFFASLFTSIGFCFPKTKKKELGLGIFLFVLVGWTHSRMAWIAFPVAALCLGFLVGRARMAFTMLGTFLLAMLVVFATSSSLQSRFRETFTTDGEVSYHPRIRIWNANWEMFKEHPFIGIGWNTNERKCQEYMHRLYPEKKDPFCGHAHSMPLQILVTTGIFGMAAFLWMWFILLKGAIASLSTLDPERRAIQVGIITAFVGFWVQGMTQWNFGDAEVTYNVIFFLSVLAVLSSSAYKNIRTT